jgi:hypothetical protein
LICHEDLGQYLRNFVKNIKILIEFIDFAWFLNNAISQPDSRQHSRINRKLRVFFGKCNSNKQRMQKCKHAVDIDNNCTIVLIFLQIGIRNNKQPQTYREEQLVKLHGFKFFTVKLLLLLITQKLVQVLDFILDLVLG